MLHPKKFTVTDVHLRLLARTYIEWDGGAYDGAPVVNIKRPYGNSDVMRDVYEETVESRGGKVADIDDDTFDRLLDGESPEYEEAKATHEQMGTVVQIALNLAGRGELIRAGEYHRTIPYDNTSWTATKKEK